jgi:hypothetical protein
MLLSPDPFAKSDEVGKKNVISTMLEVSEATVAAMAEEYRLPPRGGD